MPANGDMHLRLSSRRLPPPAKAGVAGIQHDAGCGARGSLDPGHKARDDRANMTADETILSTLRTEPAFASLRRSLAVYYGDARRDASMDTLYARLVKPGDLAFDIGS